MNKERWSEKRDEEITFSPYLKEEKPFPEVHKLKDRIRQGR